MACLLMQDTTWAAVNSQGCCKPCQIIVLQQQGLCNFLFKMSEIYIDSAGSKLISPGWKMSASLVIFLSILLV